MVQAPESGIPGAGDVVDDQAGVLEHGQVVGGQDGDAELLVGVQLGTPVAVLELLDQGLALEDNLDGLLVAGREDVDVGRVDDLGSVGLIGEGLGQDHNRSALVVGEVAVLPTLVLHALGNPVVAGQEGHSRFQSAVDGGRTVDGHGLNQTVKLLLVERGGGNLVGGRELGDSGVQSLGNLLVDSLAHALIDDVQVVSPLYAAVQELFQRKTSGSAVSGCLHSELLVSQLEDFVAAGQRDAGDELLGALLANLLVEDDGVALTHGLDVGEHAVHLQHVLGLYLVEGLAQQLVDGLLVGVELVVVELAVLVGQLLHIGAEQLVEGVIGNFLALEAEHPGRILLGHQGLGQGQVISIYESHSSESSFH